MRSHWVNTITLAALLLLTTFSVNSQETVCAVVKIEIRQELTLERQAFDARMEITNGLDTADLTNVDINVNFYDENDNVVVATSDANNLDPNVKFFIRIDQVGGLDSGDIDQATGVIKGGEVAEIHWLIIPAPGAGGVSSFGTLYSIGATLSYTVAGKDEVIEVSPDYIRVKPMPDLQLEYFLPYDVFGDDPLTSLIEPIVPFDLGIRIVNQGSGEAKDLKIESSQPEIVDNQQGFPVTFKILGTSVDDQSVENTLLANFGDIGPGQSKVAAWEMESSFSGTFVSFDAFFSHSNELGGQLTSLIDSVSVYTLMHRVKMDLLGRDSIRDFLGRNTQGNVFKLYESDGQAEQNVTSLLGSLIFQSTDQTISSYRLTTNGAAGPFVVKMNHPRSDGGSFPSSVWRSDGKKLLADNVWQYKERNASNDFDHYVMLFDANISQIAGLSYDFELIETTSVNQPPQFEAINQSIVVFVPASVNFTVLAIDPNPGLPPVLSTLGTLPQGANFSSNLNTGTFTWTPTAGQAGSVYPITIQASDGEFTVPLIVSIDVRSLGAGDSDQDGLDDDWEQTHFGDLVTSDGTGDFDLDSAKDLDEFIYSTNPTIEDRPGKSAIVFPGFEQNITTILPLFDSAVAQFAPGANSINYRFELFEANDLSTVIESIDTPFNTWQLTNAENSSLLEDTKYVLRVGVDDGITPGLWSYVPFTVNAVDSAPDLCLVEFPDDTAAVDSLRPQLSVFGVRDVDDSLIDYQFEVFDDAAATSATRISSVIQSDSTNSVSWSVYPDLTDGQTYFWRAMVSDGTSTIQCPLSSLTIALENDLPTTGTIRQPTDLARISELLPTLEINQGADLSGTALNYQFELSTQNDFNSGSELVSELILANSGVVSWTLPNSLLDNSQYFWRIRANDTISFGQWQYSQFMTDVINDSPPTSIPLQPRNLSWVETLTPELQLSEVVDPDRESVNYRFEIYTDVNLSNLDRVVNTLVPTVNYISELLDNHQYYYWRARAEDSRGGVSNWTQTQEFYVINDGVNDIPEFVFVGLDSDDVTRVGNYSIRWTDDDPDSDASISLYYSSDNVSNGTLIVAGLSEDDTEDQYLWDTSSVLTGSYYLYADISDIETTQRVYSTARLTIVSPGLLASSSTQVVSEDGTSVALNVSLTAQPISDVIVPISVSDLSEASIDNSELLFNTGNWNVSQLVTVTGVDDFIADGDSNFTLLIGPMLSSDSGFNGAIANQTNWSNLDNDVSGLVIVSNQPLNTNETGLADSFTLRLSSQPEGDVLIDLLVSDTTEVSLDQALLIFDAVNWNNSQTVIVTGLDDLDVDGNQSFQVNVSSSSTDLNYEQLPDSIISGVNADNDLAGITVIPEFGLMVDETGQQDTFTVVLNAQPQSSVTIQVISGDLTEGLVAPSTLVFDDITWTVPQTVTVTGIDDGINDGNQLFSVIVQAAQSLDVNYDGLDPNDVSVINADLLSPILHWSFENGSSTHAIDESGNGNDGIYAQPPVYRHDGIANALLMNADQYIEISEVYDGIGDFTASIWFRTSVDNQILMQQLENAAGTGNVPGYWRLRILNGRIIAEIGDITNSGIEAIGTNNRYLDDNWHMVIIQRKGDSLILDIDAGSDRVEQQGVTVDDISGGAPFRVSAIGSLSDFVGGIDDVRVYDFALQSSDISQLYSDGLQSQSANAASVYWSFEQDAPTQAFDSSGSFNHGLLVNGPSYGQFGVGTALVLDGSQYIEANNVYDGSGDFTASIWFRTAQSNQTLIQQWENAAGNNNVNAFWRLYINNAGFLSAEIRNEALTPGASFLINSTQQVQDNQWHFAVIQRDGATLVLDIDNGNERILLPATTGGINSGAPLRVSAKGLAGGFIGDVDEFRFYTIPLSKFDISQQYTNGKRSIDQIEISHWSFDNDVGNLAVDETVNGNDGLLVNDPLHFNNGSGSSLSLAATQYIEANELFDGVGDFSASLWFRSTAITQTIIQQQENAASTGNAARYWRLRQQDGRLFVQIGNSISSQYSLNSVQRYDDGLWHFVVIQRRNDTLVLDVDNGNEHLELGNITTDDISGGVPFRVSVKSVSGEYIGDVDEIRVFEYALPSWYINTLYLLGY